MILPDNDAGNQLQLPKRKGSEPVGVPVSDRINRRLVPTRAAARRESWTSMPPPGAIAKLWRGCDPIYRSGGTEVPPLNPRNPP